MKRLDPFIASLRARAAAFFTPKDRELPGEKKSFSPEREKFTFSKEKKRLLLRELLLLLLFSALLLFFEYGGERLFGALYFPVAMTVWLAYAGVSILLFFLIFIFNGGFDSDVPSPEDLLPTMSAEEKQRYIERRRRGKEKAKKLLHFLIPIAGAFLIDLAYLFLF